MVGQMDQGIKEKTSSLHDPRFICEDTHDNSVKDLQSGALEKDEK